jgi:DNA-binding response OmpR family regulator
MRILLIEDEPRIAGFVARGLTEEGHRVEVAGTLDQARSMASDGSWDLLIVDRMLPDGDGLSLVRELRRSGSAVPALCLTAMDRVEERVEGLTGGADDYLVKPFSFAELLARVQTVTRRATQSARTIGVADLRIDVPARRVSRGDSPIQLTTQEFNLLRYLAEHTGHVLTRTRLLDAVWDMRFDPGTNMVDVYMSYLRAKIDKGFAKPLLHTVRGVGYVLEDRAR